MTLVVSQRCATQQSKRKKGSDALKELEGGNEVALLFADVALPGMNDDELVRKFRARWPQLRFLLTSGFSEP